MIGLPGGLGDGPDVPDCCLRPPDAVEVAAARCGEAGVTLREVEQQLTGLLCDSAGVLGWRGDAATAASARGDRVGSAIDQTAKAIDEAGEALRSLARTVRTEGELIRALHRSREAVVVRALADMARPGLLPTLTPWDALEVRDALRDLRRLDQRIEDCVTLLRAADRRAADHLQDVAGQLRRLAALAEQDVWIGTAAPASVLAVLAQYDVVEMPLSA